MTIEARIADIEMKLVEAYGHLDMGVVEFIRGQLVAVAEVNATMNVNARATPRDRSAFGKAGAKE